MKTKQSVTESNSRQPSIACREKYAAMKLPIRSSVIAAILTVVLSITSSSFAGSATWKASPVTNDWNTASNWTPRTVPNGPADTATFVRSNQTDVLVTTDIEVNGIVFQPRASAFTIDFPLNAPTLTISGVGITNNSGIVQDFAPSSGNTFITFLNSATAGSLTAFTNNGNITFAGTSTADNSTFTNNGQVLQLAHGTVTNSL